VIPEEFTSVVSFLRWIDFREESGFVECLHPFQIEFTGKTPHFSHPLKLGVIQFVKVNFFKIQEEQIMQESISQIGFLFPG